MKLLCMSDIHCEFDSFKAEVSIRKTDKVDLCIVAGDLTNWGLRKPKEVAEAAAFLSWLSTLMSVVWIPGNHDVGINEAGDAISQLVLPKRECSNILNKTMNFQGITAHGVSLTTCFDKSRLTDTFDHMTADRGRESAVFGALPTVDVLVSHGPPYGLLDRSGDRWNSLNKEWEDVHLGSPALREYMDTKHPKLIVCGHVHESAGERTFGQTRIVNCARQVAEVEI